MYEKTVCINSLQSLMWSIISNFSLTSLINWFILSSIVFSLDCASKQLVARYANDDFSEPNILSRSNSSKNGDGSSWKGGGYTYKTNILIFNIIYWYLPRKINTYCKLQNR